MQLNMTLKLIWLISEVIGFCEFIQEWPRNWLFARHATNDTVGESGLHWLFALWTYRDIEVIFLVLSAYNVCMCVKMLNYRKVANRRTPFYCRVASFAM